ncbi:MAG: alpha/beta hydrolase [Pseudomonadota bacterium]
MLPEVKTLLEQMTASGMPDIMAMPVEEMRAAFAGQSGLTDLPGRDIASVSDRTVPGPGGDIPIRIYDPTPGQTDPSRALVFYHGGGYVIGDLESHDSVTRRLIDGLGIPGIAVDYRLAPEFPFPAPLDDCLAATQWAASGLAEVLGRPITGLIVSGDSAGGNLAAVVAQSLRSDEDATIDLQVLLYPVIDFAGDYASRAAHSEGKLLDKSAMDMFSASYCADETMYTDPKISPLYEDDLAGLAPAVVVVAEYDPLHDEGVAYADKLKAAGIPVWLRDEAGLIHGFYSFRQALPTAEARTEELIETLKEALVTLS